MAPLAYPRLVMLGPAAGTRGTVASIVEAYRASGLFKRWPVEYLATHGGGSPAERARLALQAAGRFAALLARDRKILLHLHTAPDDGFWRDMAYMAAAVAARCPVVLHIHGGGVERLIDGAEFAAPALLRYLLEHAACVTVSSHRMAAALHSVSPAVRATFLPTPVSMGPTHDGPRANLILFLGGLRAEKGIFDLLDALPHVRAAVPDVRLVCAGEGDRSRVARYAENRGVADAVKVIGWVGPSGKRALLETAAVCVLPSYAEGMPLALLEAMAAGVPVVASPVGGIPEVVVDGATGFLAAPGDSATLARLLSKLLLDRALGARVGAAGRETVRARFAAEQAVAKLEALYAQLGLAQAGLKGAPWPASLAG